MSPCETAAMVDLTELRSSFELERRELQSTIVELRRRLEAGADAGVAT